MASWYGIRLPGLAGLSPDGPPGRSWHHGPLRAQHVAGEHVAPASNDTDDGRKDGYGGQGGSQTHPERHAPHGAAAPGPPRRRALELADAPGRLRLLLHDRRLPRPHERVREPRSDREQHAARSSSTSSPAAWTPSGASSSARATCPSTPNSTSSSPATRPSRGSSGTRPTRSRWSSSRPRISTTTPSWATRCSRRPTSSSTRPTWCRWARTSCRTWNWRARSCGGSTTS